MGQNGRLNYAVDLENHAAVLVGRWVVKDAALAGVTSFTVRDRWVKALVPTVGASDAANFQAARIVFRTGKNNGYSTTVTSVVSASGITTVSIKDAIPNALAAGDGFTIYRALAIEVTAPENIKEVNGQSAVYSSLLSPNTTLGAPNAVSVGTAATQLDTGLANRRYLIIYNNGSATVYVGDSSVTTAKGIPVAAGANLTLNLGPGLALYGISGTAGQDVRVLEVA